MAVPAMIMAQQSMPNNAENNANNHRNQENQLANPMFHDFFGTKPNDSPVVLGSASKSAADARLSEPSPSASASFGASSGGGRGPVSTTSDLGSERRAVSHLEGVPFYGPRSDMSGPEIISNNKIVGSKRSNSDSTFMGSSRDGNPQMGPDSLEGSHLMKWLRNGAGGDRPRRMNDDDMVFSLQQMRPSSASLIFQHPSGISKLDRSIPLNAIPAVQYPPRGGHFVPMVPQIPSNRFRDTNPGPSNISQSAADEGSRTGIKGPGILSSINASAGVSEKNAPGPLPSGSRQKCPTVITEPESSTPLNRQGFAGNRQMTIFYGGQAHVFDDVHPNKADVIMSLAGSNGGSWSTNYSPKSNARPAGEGQIPIGDVETGNAKAMALLREYRGRISVPGSSSSQGIGFSDRVLSTPSAGGHQLISTVAKDVRSSVHAGESITKEKNEM
ncbi:protein TIFY 8 [Cannabis sativa]|uniref:Protein TIFY n=2 Tax=Cannabis sativa TaxID=3483 RepID=A0AB40E5M1_CANSA|nr:protein TIFY 8 [Cannabis sativa]KAF4373133.1 hypothetical protein F8388_019315 [Cannabis sativa]KAF4388329.1 hypothetical protein G4B88_013166 [Cannabis sativa]